MLSERKDVLSEEKSTPYIKIVVGYGKKGLPSSFSYFTLGW